MLGAKLILALLVMTLAGGVVHADPLFPLSEHTMAKGVYDYERRWKRTYSFFPTDDAGSLLASDMEGRESPTMWSGAGTIPRAGFMPGLLGSASHRWRIWLLGSSHMELPQDQRQRSIQEARSRGGRTGGLQEGPGGALHHQRP